MRRLLAPLVVVAAGLAALAGCSGATFDDVYGVPEPLDWTYFQGSTDDVTSALEETLQTNGLGVEGVRNEDGRTVLTVVHGGGSARVHEIRVEPTTAKGYGARAQVLPGRDLLPRWIEFGVSRLL